MKMPAHWTRAGGDTLAAIGALPMDSGSAVASIADPATGARLSITGVDAGAATCPSCETHSSNAAFVAVVEDLRLLFGCPSCQQLTWLSGA
jgi:hypothetical protein